MEKNRYLSLSDSPPFNSAAQTSGPPRFPWGREQAATTESEPAGLVPGFLAQARRGAMIRSLTCILNDRLKLIKLLVRGSIVFPKWRWFKC